jgi:HTH-type transcriptional regulator / antitoxin MqsA
MKGEMNKMKPQRCPVCGTGALEKKIGTETFEYKGKTRKIPNYITYACAECGESVVENATLKKSGKVLKDFQREVDGLLTGEQIKAVRKKLGLTQEQMAGIVGGGLKSLARYESGQVCQSKGMDNLLRILDAFPETLKVIQKKRPKQKSLPKSVYINAAATGSLTKRRRSSSGEKEAA